MNSRLTLGRTAFIKQGFMLCLLAASPVILSQRSLAVDTKGKNETADTVLDPASVGGEAASVVQVANLIYAGTKTSECFSDHFLQRAESGLSHQHSRRLHSVKLSSEEIFSFPLLIMTGEGEFELLESGTREPASIHRARRIFTRLSGFARRRNGIVRFAVRWR